MKIVQNSIKGLRIENKASNKATIVLYAGIGQDWWGDGSMISAKQFSDELNKLPDTVTEIELRINSPGGDVFDGIAIYNRLKQHKAKVTVYIDSLAASISSIIALAGDEIIMGEGALYMIHLPWTWAVGNRMDLDNTSNRLLDIEELMLSIYEKKAKKAKSSLTRSEIKAMLEKETWLNTDQALEHGFVDKAMEETMPIAASAINKPWLNKVPKKYVSEKDATTLKIADMKAKIAAKLNTSQKK